MKLRDYQQIAHDSVFESYEKGIRSGLCVLWTSAGKSFIATQIFKTYIERFGKKCLFLADRKELVNQNAEACRKALPDLRVDVEMNVQKGKSNADVIVASVDTLSRKGSKRINKFNPDEFGLVLVDEAHLTITDKWFRVLHYFGVHPDNFGDEKLLVGLTATPMRADKKSLGYLYDDMFCEYDIRYGMKNGWLADIEFIKLSSGTDLSKIKVSGGDFNNKELTEAVNNEVRNYEAIKAYKKYLDGECAIMYCASVEHAYTLTDMACKEGINAVCIEANTDDKQRAKWVEQFRNQEIQLIVNVSTMVTGVNFPEIKGLINLKPSMNPVNFIQTVGRGLRTSQDAMVDVFDTPEERRNAIDNSTKPACKFIDFSDSHKRNSLCTIPTLFGLHPNAVTKAKPKQYFKEVVEPLDKIKHENAIDLSGVVNLDDVDTIVSDISKGVIKKYTPDEKIKAMSSFNWLTTEDGAYEITFSKDKKTLIARKNLVDKWELIEYDFKTTHSKLLNTFNSLAGAIKVGDEYAEQMFDVKYTKHTEAWREKGVSTKQAGIIKKFFKGGAYFGNKRYPDTGQRLLYLRRKNGDKLIENAGEASELINQLFNK